MKYEEKETKAAGFKIKMGIEKSCKEKNMKRYKLGGVNSGRDGERLWKRKTN